MREFPKIRGTLFWGPYNKNPTTWATKLGSPIFGNSHVVSKLLLVAIICRMLQPRLRILAVTIWSLVGQIISCTLPHGRAWDSS